MHRVVVNVETGEVTQVEYTPEEQAEYDAAIAVQETIQIEKQPTTQELIEQQQSVIAALTARLEALEKK